MPAFPKHDAGTGNHQTVTPTDWKIRHPLAIGAVIFPKLPDFSL
jgi:hypothetical protein